jgi:hypothetical protein
MWEQDLSNTGTVHVYDDRPIWAHIAGWVILGIGAFVLLPLALLSWTWWLPIPALPFLLIGGLLLQLHLHIVADRPTGTLRITTKLFGWQIRERTYSLSDVHSLEIERVAGHAQRRASDTWYLSLYLPQETHLIGRYDTRWDALREKGRLSQTLALKRSAPPPASPSTGEEASERA